jgi:hypothetical protein
MEAFTELLNVKTAGMCSHHCASNGLTVFHLAD